MRTEKMGAAPRRLWLGVIVALLATVGYVVAAQPAAVAAQPAAVAAQPAAVAAQPAAVAAQPAVAGPAISLATGWSHACAVVTGDTLSCWGYNGSGQVGNGNTTSQLSPVPVGGPLAGVPVSQISGGAYHTCALSADALYCWGKNISGQLGNGNTTDQSRPVQVPLSLPPGEKVTQIGTGSGHTCLLSSASALYCWGYNWFGQLGDGSSRSNSNKSSPVQVPLSLAPGETVSQISVGDSHTCALSSAGAVFCWGYNLYGQVGNGNTTDQSRPVEVKGLLTGVKVTQISAGGSHTCALSSAGAVYCWGNNGNRQLGAGSNTNVEPSPLEVKGLLTGQTVSQISAGGTHTCAVASDALYCWGHNTTGQVGTSNSDDQPNPVLVRGRLSGLKVAQVSTGWEYTCAVSTSGGAYCWGANGDGQLGNGKTGFNNPNPLAVNGMTTLPGAPTDVAATAGNKRATVSWTAPASLGTGSLTGYTVTANPGGAMCFTTGATSCTIFSLTAGQPYTFTAVANTSDGSSPASSASAPVTPYVPPGAPTNVTATAGIEQATVSWTAPTSFGTGDPTGYTVTATPGSATCTTDGATSCTISGLTGGTTYTFSVVTRTTVGNSPSVTSAAVTLASLPGAPTNVTATAGNEQATVSWTAPTSFGTGNQPTFVATANPGGAFCTTTKDVTNCTITGLTGGEAYTFRVVTRTSVGNSPASVASTPNTPYTLPGAPTDVKANAGNEQATVSWKAPASLGTGTLTGYTATANPGGATCTTTASSCTITGLTGGQAYTFSVVTKTDDGSSPASTASASITPYKLPGAPTGVTATAANAQVTVSWKAPASLGTGTLTGYTATAKPGGATCATANATTCTITGLTNGTAYTVTVVTRTMAGDSIPSAPAAKVTPAVPAAPPLPAEVPAGDGPAASSTGTTFTPTSRTTTLTGTGFAPNTPVTIGIYSTPQMLTTAVTDSTGAFSVEVTVPAGYTGSHTLVATGLGPDQATMRTLTLPITIAASATGSPGGLAVTGPGLTGMIAVGLGLVAIGAVAVTAVRRRRPRLTGGTTDGIDLD